MEKRTCDDDAFKRIAKRHRTEYFPVCAPLLSLPRDILIQICCLLTIEELRIFICTCKRVTAFAEDNFILWRLLIQRDWGNAQQEYPEARVMSFSSTKMSAADLKKIYQTNHDTAMAVKKQRIEAENKEYFDSSTLSEAADDDLDFQRDLCKVWKDTTEENIRLLEKTIATGECAAVIFYGSDIKGSAATVGFDKLRQMGEYIKTLGLQNDLQKLRNIIPELKSVFLKTAQLVEEHMNNFEAATNANEHWDPLHLRE